MGWGDDEDDEGDGLTDAEIAAFKNMQATKPAKPAPPSKAVSANWMKPKIVEEDERESSSDVSQTSSRNYTCMYTALSAIALYRC